MIFINLGSFNLKCREVGLKDEEKLTCLICRRHGPNSSRKTEKKWASWKGSQLQTAEWRLEWLKGVVLGLSGTAAHLCGFWTVSPQFTTFGGLKMLPQNISQYIFAYLVHWPLLLTLISKTANFLVEILGKRNVFEILSSCLLAIDFGQIPSSG